LTASASLAQVLRPISPAIRAEGRHAMDADERTVELCDCVRRYLAAHPDAADSLRGIRQWWLPARLRDVTLEELEQALAQLVARGEVQRSTLPGAGELYARSSATDKGTSCQKS
jgi:hypothetical protein